MDSIPKPPRGESGHAWCVTDWGQQGDTMIETIRAELHNLARFPLLSPLQEQRRVLLEQLLTNYRAEAAPSYTSIVQRGRQLTTGPYDYAGWTPYAVVSTVVPSCFEMWWVNHDAGKACPYQGAFGNALNPNEAVDYVVS